VLVLDWGLARWSGAIVADPPHAGEPPRQAVPTTAHGAVLGTPGFMAPEQKAGEAVDARADVYGLGALLAWLLGSAPAAEGRTAGLPRPLAAIVERATAARPDGRYPSAAALVEDVRRYLDGLAVTAHREGTVEKVVRFARRHRVAIALLAAYLVMRVALLVFGRL
jgi:serine/threonine protein kinase